MAEPILHVVVFAATHFDGRKTSLGRLLVWDAKTWLLPNDADAKRYPYLSEWHSEPLVFVPYTIVHGFRIGIGNQAYPMLGVLPRSSAVRVRYQVSPVHLLIRKATPSSSLLLGRGKTSKQATSFVVGDRGMGVPWANTGNEKTVSAMTRGIFIGHSPHLMVYTSFYAAQSKARQPPAIRTLQGARV